MTTTPPLPADAFTVLLVCTGNICRSALAERLGRHYLAEQLGNDAVRIRLASAGTRAVADSPMDPDTARALAALGPQAGDFRARRLTDRLLADADLTLTMSRKHRTEALALAPRALNRTFTLREAAALLELLEESGDVPADSFADRARGLVRRIAAIRARRPGSHHDDIRDPVSQPLEVHREVSEAIAEALHPVLRRFAALVTPGGATHAD